MNVVLAANDQVCDGVELVLYSLLTHNKGVNIFIFTMSYLEVEHDNGLVIIYRGINETQGNKIKKLVKYLDSTSNIQIIDVLPEYMENLRGSVNERSSFTPFAALRLLADLVLPNMVEHFLYFDCDIAVTGDISYIYDDYAHRNINYSASFCEDACDGLGEMVSGVMILNLKKNRETGFLERARHNYMTNVYNYPDQCALRDADTADRLPANFGYCYPLENANEMPLVLHFTNQLSPKVYERDHGREYFYKRYPFLKYVKEGLELMDRINF